MLIEGKNFRVAKLFMGFIASVSAAKKAQFSVDMSSSY